MSKKSELFEQVLTSPFDNDAFVKFVREFLNNIQLVAPTKYNKEYSNFSFYVDGYYHIGNYISDDKDKIAIFSVCLHKGDTVERARGMQRNFVKALLEKGGCAAAIVAFFTEEDATKWRLSFIRMDYEFSKGKITEKLTPAKRYSYLVGQGEPCHTAKQRLYPIFNEDNENPGLDDIEEAFSVEKVTNEFFNLYKEKYIELKEYLESNEDFMSEATYRNFTSEQFAKKLMGQIVFLYFIQKKGWLGVDAIPLKLTEKQYKDAFFAKGNKSKEIVPRVYAQQADGTYRIVYEQLQALSDEDEETLAGIVKGKPWGTGPKNFMRKTFEGCIEAGKNYFDDYLEPLFYTGLNKNRGENGFYAPLHRRIPFLNGGLFEQLDNYEWENNNFNIPNEIFSNVETKGRDADGILDIFDRYNFTMNEDEPMEREVAIDPEMLGKVFENLLDVKDRKSKGAFYTPREIVHYMCQETLINHLVTKTELPEEDIRDFVLYGDLMKDEDTSKSAREGDKKMLISPRIFDLNTGTNRLKELDDILANVKVADLAVGSGAFPLGMLNEIVKARETLSAYMAIGMNGLQKKTFYAYDRKPYELKVNTIKNCIFACDIEPSAVDIAKLRLWLSIVIDDEIAETAGNGEFNEHTRPRQLPNLDCNIICGNSLIDEFKGIPLITESVLLHNESENRQQNIFQGCVDGLISKLIELQDKLFFIKDHNEKEEIKQEIQKIYDDIILEQLQGNLDVIEDYYNTKSMPSKPFILWQLYFPRVFRDNGGFDIVIGNPPYIQLQKSIDEEGKVKLGDLYEPIKFKTFAKTGDIYCLFYEKGYDLLRSDGVVSLITSNKWMRAGYGEKLRGFLATETNPLLLIDFAGQKIFESATVDVNILMFAKNKNNGQTISCTIEENCSKNLSVYVKQHYNKMSFTTNDSWVILSDIEHSIQSKVNQIGTPLSQWSVSINYGIKTGLNDAFIISGEKKDELIAEDPKSAEIIRPILRGKDIKRYEYNFADLWIIATFPSRNYDIDNYPAIKRYLLSFGMERLEQSGKVYIIDGQEVKSRKKTSNKWFETQDSISYWNDFSKQKIVYREISDAMDACMVGPDILLNNKCYLITGEHLFFLLAFFNSSLFNKVILPQANVTGGKGEAFLSKIRVIKPTPKIEKRIETLLLSTPTPSEDALAELDKIFIDLYGLNAEEKAFLLEKPL